MRHVVEALADGRQPDAAEIAAVGYLMRTTAVYGSGKFGAADRADIAARPELAAPFQAEMLTVWLIRAFTVDFVEHMARRRGGDHAVRLDPDTRRNLGVGNSTRLGMAPFVVRHPVLPNNWMTAREEALARVLRQDRASAEAVAGLRHALDAAIRNAAADVGSCMGADEAATFRLDGAISVGELRAILAEHYGWALSIDFNAPESVARFWYVSEEKLEPRLGERASEEGAALEQPLCIARLASELDRALQARDADERVATLLLAHPEHRYLVRRAQIVPESSLRRATRPSHRGRHAAH